MYTVKTLPEFDAWLDGVKDRVTRLRLARRLTRRSAAILVMVGSGVFEMREFFGPGWRMYYVMRRDVLIVMLGGGDKSRQAEDIAAAVARANTLEE